MIRLWLHGVSRSAHGCIGFVEVWVWGGFPSVNVSDLSFFLLFQCYYYLFVTSRMVFLFVLQSFDSLNEVSRYPRVCVTWCFNRYMTVLLVQFVMAGDTDPTCGQYLEF